jgi:hypothetical protein
LLIQNNIDVSRLIEFRTSNDYKYKLTAARYTDWSVDCADAVQSITGKKADLDELSHQFLLLFILYIISFVLSCILYIARVWAYLINSTKAYKWILTLRIVSWILVVPSCFICLIASKQFANFFLNIAQLGCSDSATNSQLLGLGTQFQDKLNYKNTIYLVLSLIGMLLEICMAIIDLNLLPKA